MHEWGLVALVAGSTEAQVGTGVLRHVVPPMGMSFFGTGAGYGRGGKPVLYVHLDEGAARADLSITLGLAASVVVEEHWPPAQLDSSRLRFDVHAEVGPCTARTPPPSTCATSDRFCESAEIPRYEADHDVCLGVGEARTDLLFYRASGVDTSTLPLFLDSTSPLMPVVFLTRREGMALDGPVLFLERARGGAPRIVRITVGAGSRLLETVGTSSTDLVGTPRAGGSEDLVGTPMTVEETRTLLATEARARGLTEAEADAFVDAWSPAFFDHCRRHGPEAHGDAPPGLSEANRSLLYFAPPSAVDAMLPMTVDPPARELRRVFLVRLVDGASIPQPPPRPSSPPASYRERGSRRAVVRPTRQPTVRGGLSPDQVRRVVQRNISQLQHCYEQGLARDPDLEGTVDIDYTILASGAVGSARVAETSFADPAVANCAANAFRRWTYPMPDPTGPVTVRFYVRFSLAAL